MTAAASSGGDGGDYANASAFDPSDLGAFEPPPDEAFFDSTAQGEGGGDAGDDGHGAAGSNGYGGAHGGRDDRESQGGHDAHANSGLRAGENAVGDGPKELSGESHAAQSRQPEPWREGVLFGSSSSSEGGKGAGDGHGEHIFPPTMPRPTKGSRKGHRSEAAQAEHGRWQRERAAFSASGEDGAGKGHHSAAGVATTSAGARSSTTSSADAAQASGNDPRAVLAELQALVEHHAAGRLHGQARHRHDGGRNTPAEIDLEWR